MRPDEEAGGGTQHHRAEQLLHPDVEVHRVGQDDDDDVGEEDAVLVVGKPQGAPIQVAPGVLDDRDIGPLVVGQDIDAVGPDEPEVGGDREAEPEDGEHVHQPRVEMIDDAFVLGFDHVGLDRRRPVQPDPTRSASLAHTFERRLPGHHRPIHAGASTMPAASITPPVPSTPAASTMPPASTMPVSTMPAASTMPADTSTRSRAAGVGRC